jgi:chaperonin GroES
MKLDERRKTYSIPPTPYQPAAKNVLVYRLPSEERTAGGLYVPQEHQTKKSRGVLIAAGLSALDVLADHLIEVGDIVWFGHYAGRDAEVKRDAGSDAIRMVQIKVEDILGSEDTLDRLADYEVQRVTDDCEHNGTHIYAKKTAKRKAA